MADQGPWADYAESGPWADYAAQQPERPPAIATNPAEYDPQSAAYQEKYGATSGNSFLQNAQIGIGKFYTDAMLGARQMYAQGADAVTGGNAYAGLQQQAADKRAIDAPIQATGGGKVGQVLGALPLAFVPGANSYAGAGLIGGLMGATMPTVEGESRALNTGIGAGAGIAGKYAGDVISNWITNRAAQPFMGWNQNTGNAAAAQSVGSSAERLDQPAIHETTQRFNQIFRAARDPNVRVPLPADPTLSAVVKAQSGLNESSKAALESNPVVKDLMAHLERGGASAEQLGQISSELGSEAAGQMASKMGDRKLGIALFKLQDHVDDLVGSSIRDPELKAAYDAAMPQYRNFKLLTTRPTILNSATGDVHLNNLGKYLQRYGGAGYKEGTNTSPLYEAARFGQATRLGSAPSPPILQPIKWAQWHAINNPVVNAAGGLTSRALAPFAPGIKYGLPGLAEISAPVALPYLEQ